MPSFLLMLQIGPVLALPAPQPVMDALLSAQVTTSAGQADGFQLTFAVSNKSLINLVLLPSGYFDPGTRVILMVILAGLPVVLMDGIITRQDLAPSNTPGSSTLTITGEDLSVLMSFDVKQVCYPGLPAEGVVEAICAQYAQYGILPEAIPPVLLDVPDPVEEIPTQSGTDLDHLRALATEAGYVFFIQPGPLPGMSTAYWGPEVRIGVPQPALNVNLDADTNVETLSFSYDGLSRTQLTVAIQDLDTGLSVAVPVPNVNILRPPLTARPAVILRHAPLEDSAKLNTVQAALMGLGQGRCRGRRRDRPGHAGCAALRPHPDGQATGVGPGRRGQLRRLLLRDERHPQPQARRVQAELPADPRRHRVALPGGAGMTTTTSQSVRYLGKYRGTVASNIDPLQQGRLLVQVPDVLADDPCIWALPALPGPSSQAGMFALPPINAKVWVEFEQGDPQYAVWVGCFPGSTADLPAIAAAVPAAACPIILQTTGLNTVALSDLPGAAGGLLLQSAAGAFVSVSDTGIVLNNGQGAVITLTGASVTVNGGALVVT